MAFNVREFSSRIAVAGLAQSNLFKTNITFPSSINGSSEYLSFFCMNANLPSLEVGTSPIKVNGYGPAESRPTDMEFQPVTLTIILDGYYTALRIFHQWMQAVVHYDKSSGASTVQGGKKTYEFGYKEDYAGALEVTMMRRSGEEAYTYKFGGAFPISVGEITPAWENGAEVMTITITFTYSEFSVTGSTAGVQATSEIESLTERSEETVSRSTRNDALSAENDTREVVPPEETVSTTTEGSVEGWSRNLVFDSPEYQEIYEAELSRMPGAPDNVSRSLQRNAAIVADAKHKAALIDGTIEPPEGSGIVVTPASD